MMETRGSLLCVYSAGRWCLSIVIYGASCGVGVFGEWFCKFGYRRWAQLMMGYMSGIYGWTLD